MINLSPATQRNDIIQLSKKIISLLLRQNQNTIMSEQPPLDPTEEYVSYDVESHFTNVPVMETIDYILDEIYEKDRLPHLCKRSLFKKLLLKLS